MQKKIAITGGIGSGKSAVIEICKNLGYPIFSCDEIYKEVIKEKAYVEKIREAFPSVVVNGEIDRKKLSQTVFSNEALLSVLNGIAHPLIMKRLIDHMEKTESDLIFAEVPLLFEGKFEHYFDEIIVVTRNKGTRINAVCKRDRVERAEAIARISAQFDYDNCQDYLQKINAHIIQNEGTLDQLKIQVMSLLKRLL